MATIAFDTYAFVKRLTSAGMPEAQAEVLAGAQAELIDEKLVTKADIEALKVSMQHDLELQKRDLKIWFGSVLVVAVGVILAAIRYLPAPHG